jgi:hypothetical protein
MTVAREDATRSAILRSIWATVASDVIRSLPLTHEAPWPNDEEQKHDAK